MYDLEQDQRNEQAALDPAANSIYTQNDHSPEPHPTGRRTSSCADFKNGLIQKILDADQVDVEFGQIHLLVDKLFQNEDDMEQSNSYLFHVKLALILSSMVQMKNSLMKYLDYEINDANPEMNLMTQVP